MICRTGVPAIAGAFLLYRKLLSCKVKTAPRGCAKAHSLFCKKHIVFAKYQNKLIICEFWSIIFEERNILIDMSVRRCLA